MLTKDDDVMGGLTDQNVLSDMFPSVSLDRIKELLASNGLNRSIEILLDHKAEQVVCISDEELPPTELRKKDLTINDCTGPGPSSSCSKSLPLITQTTECSDLQNLVASHSARVINTFSEFSLTVDRSSPEHFWMSLLSFYKGALRNPEKLKRSLVVTYENTGEQGCDAGALKKEFFEDSIKAINDQLFEGDAKRQIPKKNVSLELCFEVAGAVFAHSVFQEGPSMPWISPAVFEYILKGDTNECFPVKEDIPINAATYDLVQAIEKIDNAVTDEELDTVLEQASVMTIINSSTEMECDRCDH